MSLGRSSCLPFPEIPLTKAAQPADTRTVERKRGTGTEIRHPAWISRVRARARDNRGVALIEAAIFTPVFFVLIFGVMEIGLAMNDSLALSSSVKAGARMASASGNDQKADLYTVLNIARESSAISRPTIQQIVIYKPGAFGEEPTDGCKNGTPQPGICNVYDYDDLRVAEVQVKEETRALAAGETPDASKMIFGCKPTSPDRYWCPTDRRVTQPTPGPDYVGVYMRVEHKWVTKLFGSVKTLENQSIIRLEPRSS